MLLRTHCLLLPLLLLHQCHQQSLALLLLG